MPHLRPQDSCSRIAPHFAAHSTATSGWTTKSLNVHVSAVCWIQTHVRSYYFFYHYYSLPVRRYNLVVLLCIHQLHCLVHFIYFCLNANFKSTKIHLHPSSPYRATQPGLYALLTKMLHPPSPTGIQRSCCPTLRLSMHRLWNHSRHLWTPRGSPCSQKCPHNRPPSLTTHSLCTHDPLRNSHPKDLFQILPHLGVYSSPQCSLVQ